MRIVIAFCIRVTYLFLSRTKHTKRRQKKRVSRELKTRATWLVHWLNYDLKWLSTPPPLLGRERILQIIGLLSQIQAKRRPNVHLWKQPEIEQMARDLNSIMKAYRTWMAFDLDHRPGKIGEIIYKQMWGTDLNESRALSLIVELLKVGLFDDLTMCKECKQRWVFRIGAHGHFCSVKCRTADYEKQPARQKRKRQLAKDRYYDPHHCFSSWKKPRRKQ